MFQCQSTYLSHFLFLPEAEFVDIGVPTMQLRMIKSAEEHALIRQGARVSDIGGAACVEAIAEGPAQSPGMVPDELLSLLLSLRHPDGNCRGLQLRRPRFPGKPDAGTGRQSNQFQSISK